jgi:hypothetical protein
MIPSGEMREDDVLTITPFGAIRIAVVFLGQLAEKGSADDERG